MKFPAVRSLLLRPLSVLLLAALPILPVRAASVVTQWCDATLQAIRDTHPGPTLVARDLAIVHTCCYDAWAAYDRVAAGTRFGTSARRPPAERTLANKQKAISFAAYRALVDLFPQPEEVASFDALMASLGYDPLDVSTDPATASGVGNRCAAAVLEFRHGDGSNQLGDLHPGAYSDYTGYQPVNDPDHVVDPSRWQPLRVSDGKGGTVVQNCTTPQWGNVTPFALPWGSALRPLAGPARYGSAEYRRQAKAAVQNSASLTDRKKMIAEYWADGPSSELPPGHWCLFAEAVSLRRRYGLDQEVKLFFVLSNALLDAGIGCWETKHAYDSVRPITAVRFLYAGKKIRSWGGPGQGTQLIDGAAWQTYGQAATVVTPPFPEFTSGHSTFSAAGAEVLKRFTGSDRFGYSVRISAGSSRSEPGLTPHQDLVFQFPTFTSAAAQAGMSRIYGGIHFPDANVRGQQMGRRVGALAWEKARQYFTGSLHPR